MFILEVSFCLSVDLSSPQRTAVFPGLSLPVFFSLSLPLRILQLSCVVHVYKRNMNFSLGGVFSFFTVSYKYIIYIVYQFLQKLYTYCIINIIHHLLTIRYQRVLTGLPIVKLTSSIFTAKRSQFSSLQKLCSFSAIVVFGNRAQQKRCY